ncbi:MAG: glutaminase, partial [Gammaproteobacteria bacterium]
MSQFTNLNYQEILEDVYTGVRPLLGSGTPADYIPALASVNPGKFGIAIETLGGEQFSLGDVDEKFSIQSISKVFNLVLAFKLQGEKLWERVGIEPSGNPFDSLVQLEYEHGIPRNPFINSG